MKRESDKAALLARALIAHARSARVPVEVTGIRSRPWASATFVGERIELDLRVDGSGNWAARLGDADLPVRGACVADLSVRAAAGAFRVEALLLHDM